MSPPIYTPNGSEVTTITAPDGSEVQEVRDPDGNVVFSAGPAIPDSALYRYPIFERSTSTIEESINNEDATANGTTNVTGNWIEGYAESGDGTDDYIDMPPAISSWVQTQQAQWMTFTVDADPSNIIENDTYFGYVDTNVSGNEEWNITDGSTNGDGFLSWRIRGSDGNTVGIETDNIVIDGTKKRLVFQRTSASASDMEIYVNGSQASTSVTSSGTYNGTLNGDLDLYFLASYLNGSSNRHMQSSLDDIIFGELGTTLSAGEIQDDFNRQPWS